MVEPLLSAALPRRAPAAELHRGQTLTSSADRERNARYSRTYREKNREKLRAKDKAYYQRPGVKERNNAASRKWYAANKEHRKQYEAARKADPNYSDRIRDFSLKTKYGITSEVKLAMMAVQHNRCAIAACGHEFKDISDAQVDHCHATGKLRALLCGRCNRALGLLKDNPDRIRCLAAYVEAHA